MINICTLLLALHSLNLNQCNQLKFSFLCTRRELLITCPTLAMVNSIHPLGCTTSPLMPQKLWNTLTEITNFKFMLLITEQMRNKFGT